MSISGGVDKSLSRGNEIGCTTNRTMEEFDRVIGLNKLKVFHFNDSKRDLGSRIDRHEHIGKGFLGLEPFRFLMNDERFAGIPKILETPKGDEMKEDIENLNVLRSLIENKTES